MRPHAATGMLVATVMGMWLNTAAAKLACEDERDRRPVDRPCHRRRAARDPHLLDQLRPASHDSFAELHANLTRTPPVRERPVSRLLLKPLRLGWTAKPAEPRPASA